MDRSVALVTGAAGEMGSLLLPALAARGVRVVALDVVGLPPELRSHCAEAAEASVLDHDTLHALFERFRPRSVFHLASILSSSAERDPDLAHRVNVEGTYGLLRLAKRFPPPGGDPARFLFPSSIAVYALPDLDAKAEAGAVQEHQWNRPTGMYGCNKLYCELVGAYFSAEHAGGEPPDIDFRAIRFPGLISAETLPTGGTTDYAPEMIHAAAQGKPYACFVREDTTLPFMTMPDAIEALLRLAATGPERLSTRVYNVRAFRATAADLYDEVRRHFPAFRAEFEPAPRRQAIVDSWPADLDDGRARRDWGFAPRHDLGSALADYLVPALQKRYAGV